jgi:EAL domain-containing protein (putative c-di-GMP-specific phosphodiesterase class I)
MSQGRESRASGGGDAGPLDWPGRIERALERDLFVLHGQRIVDVASGATLRHELFLRMVDRQRLIPAGDFVLAAEEFGSIREIDRWVVGQAIEIAAKGHPVDVNLSVRSMDDAMLALIRSGVGGSGADPGDLVFELSDGQHAGTTKSHGEFVRVLSDLGCRIALDGFIEGGRRASLLRRLPIDYVKLGRPFVSDLASDRGNRRTLGSAIHKAHRTGQRVIAHGVEDLATLQLLEGLGIDEAQGFVLGPPESIDSLLGAAV